MPLPLLNPACSCRSSLFIFMLKTKNIGLYKFSSSWNTTGTIVMWVYFDTRVFNNVKYLYIFTSIRFQQYFLIHNKKVRYRHVCMKTCFCHLTVVWRPLAEERFEISTQSIHRWKVHFMGYNCVSDNIRHDTIGEFNVDSKAEYSALSSTRSQKKKLKQTPPVPL